VFNLKFEPNFLQSTKSYRDGI